MSKIIIATNPGDDPVTKHLSYWVQEIKSYVATIDDVEIHLLEDEDVTRDNFVAIIEEKNPILVLVNGHGTYETMLGYDRAVLVASNHNLDMLSDRIIHSLSCSSGKDLGPKLIEVGSKAFIGYIESFQLYRLKDDPIIEGEDEISSLFLKPAFDAIKALCDGDTTSMAHQKSQRSFRENFLKVITTPSISDGDKQLLGSALLHDWKHQVLLGDHGVTI
jgi:hypothetical protein